jgi:hypothetical protein
VTLPTTGTHAILLDPTQTYTGTVTVTAYDVPADVTGSLVINDPATPVSLPVPGQRAELTFAGTATQAITVRGTSSTLGCLSLVLIWPGAGSSSTPCGSSFSAGWTLPQTTTYTLRVDPAAANAGSVDLRVTSP